MVALSDDAQFAKVIRRLLDASGPEEVRRLLQDLPWLTSEEAYLKLTQTIADKRRQRDLLGMTCLMTCRGLLRRCRRLEDVNETLATQPGWPVRNKGPLNQLLALPGDAAADERIQRANLASADVDQKEEPDFCGLISYHLGWGYQVKVDEGLAEALAQAITHFEAAEAAWQWEGSLFGRRFLGRAQDSLGRLYMQRRHGDRSQDVETALAWFQKAHETFGEGVPEQLDVLILLGKAYLSRIRGERLHNIEQGIAWYVKALSLAERKGSEKRLLGYIEHSLAVAYRLRLHGPRASNYEEAKKLAEKALRRFDRRSSPEDWARTAGELATIYAHRQDGDRDENLEKAIEYAKQALDVYDPQDHPLQWTLAQLTLGNLYCDRVSGVRAENDRRAIRCFKDILDQCDKESNPLRWAEAMNNLGTVYASRRAGCLGVNYRKATHCFRQALEVRQPEALPSQARQTAANLGHLHFEQGYWSQACEAFATAIRAADLLYQAAATPEARRAELREGRGLPPRLAYALSRTAEEADDAPLQNAALTLEQNRARWLSEALALHSQKPPDVPECVWQTFITCREHIRGLQAEARLPEDAPSKRDYLALSGELAAAYTTLDETVTHIREHDDTFMPAPTFDQIRAAVEADCPLTYFAVSPTGTLALVVTPTAVHPVHTPLTEDGVFQHITGYTPEEAQSEFSGGGIPTGHLGGYLGAYDAWRRSPRDPAARAVWFAALDETTHWLWDALMGPLVQTLADLEVHQVTLIPQGYLGLFPLHAAWTDGGRGGGRRYAMDDLTLTYAPNARALSAARQIAARVPPDRLLAVDEPQPVSGNPLPNSAQEVLAACEHFARRKVLGGEAATEQAVRKQLSHHTVLHFSCHGFAVPTQPLESGLLMSNDETLTLRDVLALRLENARLAVLSACETGISGTDLPDEVVSLPTGLAQAGIAGVVASLWSVSDLSTMMLMARFYELWKADGLEPSAALRQAQLWIRDTTNGQKADYFKGFLPEFESQKLPLHVADTLYKSSILARPDENDFEHPFHWAAFAYTGV
jgi:CHAT domain-containing protein/tetratricopeptide (TPR) repeat protein